jgi:hypothetical protein
MCPECHKTVEQKYYPKHMRDVHHLSGRSVVVDLNVVGVGQEEIPGVVLAEMASQREPFVSESVDEFYVEFLQYITGINGGNSKPVTANARLRSIKSLMDKLSMGSVFELCFEENRAEIISFLQDVRDNLTFCIFKSYVNALNKLADFFSDMKSAYLRRCQRGDDLRTFTGQVLRWQKTAQSFRTEYESDLKVKKILAVGGVFVCTPNYNVICAE